MKFDRKAMLRAGEGGYGEYRIPGIVTWKGELVFCCEARAASHDDWGRIDLQIRGEDGLRHTFVPFGGKTGEGRTAALREGDTLNNPTLIADGDRLHLLYHVNYRYAFHAVSLDGGRTWTRHREITDAYREFDCDWNVCATGPGHGIRLESGRLLVPVWLANGEIEPGEGYRVRHYPSVSGALYSDDGGETWHAGALFADHGERKDANETACACLSEGGVLFSIRHRGERRCRSLAVSEDGGETVSRQWMEESLHDPMCFGSLYAEGGTVLFSNCDSQQGRVNLTLKRKNGDAWEKIATVDEIGGYSDLAAQNGKIRMLYERTVDGKIPEIVLAKEV